MKSANESFVDMANPHAWVLAADNLHEQAISLFHNRGKAVMTVTRYDGFSVRTDRVNKSVFLLGGFALENAIKAFLVYENPEWVSNGKLAKQLKSHSLLLLQRKSALIPYKKRYLWALQEFEDGLESWARYPCGLSVEDSGEESVMSTALWLAYLRIMRAYGNRMESLLSDGWNGPHGFYGRWTFEGAPFSLN